MRILVTGGSGHLGSDFARAATAAGHVIRIMSRRAVPADTPFEWAQADLDTGEGLAEAVMGVDAVIHAASNVGSAAKTDVDGTRKLTDACRAAGVGHVVYVSIVGIDRIPFLYYRHKLEAERVTAESGVPYSILRAAQFHYFVDLLLQQAARIPGLLLVPAGFRVQTIAMPEVSSRLLDILEAGPGGRLPDLVGPRAMSFREAGKLWLAARGMHRLVVPLWLPGKVAAGFRGAYNTLPEQPSGTVTWEAWLAERYGGR